MRRVLLRADGNSKIGVGHIHRILAITQILSNKFECLIFIQRPSEAIKLLFTDKYPIIDLPEKLQNDSGFYAELIPFIRSTDIVVLDGYRFDTSYQIRIKEHCHKLVSIDDIHAFHFVSDLIINHSGGINPEVYSLEDYSQLCLGPKYSLVKREFLKARKRTEYSMPPDLLINLGGADPLNATIGVLNDVLKLTIKFNLIHVVIGEAYIFKEELVNFIKLNNAANIKLHINCSTVEMIAIMQKSAVAILSPSTVLFEYCCIGGLVFLKRIAENQNDVFSYFISNGLALSIDDSPAVLNDISEFESNYKSLLNSQLSVFDQQSGERVLNLFSNL